MHLYHLFSNNYFSHPATLLSRKRRFEMIMKASFLMDFLVKERINQFLDQHQYDITN